MTTNKELELYYVKATVTQTYETYLWIQGESALEAECIAGYMICQDDREHGWKLVDQHSFEKALTKEQLSPEKYEEYEKKQKWIKQRMERDATEP